MAVLQVRLRGPNEERGYVPGHLVDSRLGSVGVGHLALRRQRRRHGDVEVREIGVEVEVGARLGFGRYFLAMFIPVRVRIGPAGQQRIDIGRTALARFGDQRKVRRESIVIRSTRRDLVREGRRETVGRQSLARRRLARVRIDRRHLRLPVGRDLLDLGVVVAEPLQLTERDQIQAVAG